MINKSVNNFYTQFLFKIETLPHESGFLLDVTAALLNNLSPYVREFLIPEEVQVSQRLTMENNHQGNQSILLVRNAAAEVEKKTRTIKLSVQPEGGSLHHRTFMIMTGGSSSIKTSGLSSRF